MKLRKFKIVAAMLTLVGFTACDNFLNVLPDQRVVLDSRDKIHRLLASAYPDASHWMLAEFASDNTDMNGGEFQRFDPLGNLEDDAFFWRVPNHLAQDSPHILWNSLYSAIAASNHALEAIELLESRGYHYCLNHQRGEALITRAYGHFLLVNLFSQHFSPIHSNTDLGIPFIDAPERTVNPQYDRRTVAYVYARIEQDILAGINLLDDTQLTVAAYRFNRQAAAAFAARFFLFKGDWERVDYFATRALEGRSLRNWEAAAAENNVTARGNNFIYARDQANLLLRPTHSHWSIVHGPFGVGNQFSHNSRISRTETNHSAGPWGNSDAVFFYRAFTYGIVIPNYIMVKFTQFFEFTDAIAGIGFRRLVHADFTTDETLLMRAEARAMMGEFDAAVADINIFLSAFARPAGRNLTLQRIVEFYSGLDYYTPYIPTPKKELNPDFDLQPGTQTYLIHCILHLRRILTMHEGLRWFDVKRWGIQIYRREITGGGAALRTVVLDVLPPRDPRRAFQIPDAVIGAGLVPNPRPDVVNLREHLQHIEHVDVPVPPVTEELN